jgi:hypothetical protein
MVEELANGSVIEWWMLLEGQAVALDKEEEGR